jgi:hypothetical protein
VFSAKDVADRAALDAMTSIGSKNAFPTASSLCGGAAVTMEYAHSRAEVTFAVWTTSQQVAATIRAAVVTDAFIEEFGFELGGECELRDARVDQLEDVELGRTNAEAQARLAKHRAYASLGGAAGGRSREDISFGLEEEVERISIAFESRRAEL